LHQDGLFLTLNHDARNHEFKIKKKFSLISYRFHFYSWIHAS